MSLKTVEIELGKLGYDCTFHKITDSLHCGILDDKTGMKFGSMFRVFEDGNNYVCAWFNRNIPMEDPFTSVSDLVEFVKKKFPDEG